MKAIIHAKIYDYETFIEDGFMIFDENIVEVGSMKDYKGHHEVFDAEGMLLIPGLINSHTHIYSTLFRGAPLQAAPENFLEVLEQIWWKFDRELSLDMVKESTKAYAQDSLLSGVTSLIDHHASGQIKDSLMTIHHELHRNKIKHLLCFETSDRFDVDQCIDENVRYSFEGHFGLHASISLSDETLKKVESKLDKPIHIHVAESEVDELLSVANHDKRVVERLDDYNLLKEDSILAHCLYIDESEAQIIKDRKCQVAVNPSSNMNNAVGIYNNKILQDFEIPVLVGTDGLGPNVAKAYQNLYYVGNLSRRHPSKVSLDWIKSQLMNSYNYFNRMYQCKIGKFEKGYSSDFILINYNEITPLNKDNIFGHILFGVFEALKPYAVYIDGNRVVDKHNLIEKDPINIKIVEELWRRL
jgi:cytosine/adenosine deaminase-related metal-dependent hydrolase